VPADLPLTAHPVGGSPGCWQPAARSDRTDLALPWERPDMVEALQRAAD